MFFIMFLGVEQKGTDTSAGTNRGNVFAPCSRRAIGRVLAGAANSLFYSIILLAYIYKVTIYNINLL